MQLYLDSANIEHIRHANSLGILSGVTTNPSLLAKEDPKVDIKKRILEIHDLVGGHLSVEVISTDTKGMLHEADEILKWFPDATIKIPMIPAGLAATRYLYNNNVPTNVTLVFSANQAIAAQNAGATYVSVFMGRLDDISTDCVKVLEDIAQIWDIHDYESEIIAASLRNPTHLTQAALAGAHIATVPYNVLMQSLKHPLTDSGLQAFLNDYSKLQEEIRKLKTPVVETPVKEPVKIVSTKQEKPVQVQQEKEIAAPQEKPVQKEQEKPVQVQQEKAVATPQEKPVPAVQEKPIVNKTVPVAKKNRRGSNMKKTEAKS